MLRGGLYWSSKKSFQKDCRLSFLRNQGQQPQQRGEVVRHMVEFVAVSYDSRGHRVAYHAECMSLGKFPHHAFSPAKLCACCANINTLLRNPSVPKRWHDSCSVGF